MFLKRIEYSDNITPKGLETASYPTDAIKGLSLPEMLLN